MALSAASLWSNALNYITFTLITEVQEHFEKGQFMTVILTETLYVSTMCISLNR